MLCYFLFRPKVNDYFCSYIYVQEAGKIVSYSFDDEYIVKSDEKTIKSFGQLEEYIADKNRKSKTENQPLKLVQKEFPDVKAALYYLEGSLEDFNESVPARKRLPEIINPYDMDFDDTADSADSFRDSSFKYDKDLANDDDVFGELNDDDGYNEYPDDDDDDYYK